jgi:hypothetical protein
VLADLDVMREWPSHPERLYVVVDRINADPADEPLNNRAVWTLSPWPDEPGWETDCATKGYGLPRAVADLIAAAYNETQERLHYAGMTWVAGNPETRRAP